MCLRALLVAGLIAVLSSGAAAQSSPFTSIDVTGAGTGAHEGTAALGIDAAGDVAGVYIDTNGNEHAFVLPAGGTMTPFDASGTGGAQIETIPIGFDTAGNIAGLYHDASGRVHGFVRSATTGTIAIFDVTGEDTGKMEGTFPVCINGAGWIAGNYSTTIATASGTNSFSHGFVRDASGTITIFDAVPLPTVYGSINPGTYVVSINASGEVSGFYIDGIGTEHGFLRDASGTISTFEAPAAGTEPGQGTIATGIDAAGDVIGIYADASNVIHGFMRSASTGTITPIDAPGAGTASFQGTYPDAFDAAGDISGSFTDTNYVAHGFVLPAGGTIAAYDAPGSSASASLRRGAGGRLNSKLSRLGKSYGLSVRSRKSNSPLIQLRRLLAKAGALRVEGAGPLVATSAKYSGTITFGDLILKCVNPTGEIVGLYSDGDYVVHSYLRAANGSITTLDDPTAGTAADQGTASLAINASGTIAGTYADANSVLHGFIYESSTLTATTTTLTPAPTPNPSVYWEPVTLTATVSTGSGVPPNGEIVNFLSGITMLGNGPLLNGVAIYGATNLPTGTNPITASYPGDGNFAGSTSTAVNQVVNKASTTTTLASSLNPSTTGQSVTLIANVSGQFAGTATGTVAFSYGSGTSLGSAMLSGGTASLATTALPTGTDAVIAVYAGDGDFSGSTSSALSQVVNDSVSLNPMPIISGISPGSADAGGAAFTLTVNGLEFVASSAVYWGTSALTTTYVSATQLTAQVPAADIASGGTAVAITVVTPGPGGRTSDPFQFEVDSSSGSTTGPTFSSTTATVTAGSTATYPVTLPSSVESATVTCLNLPTGASCSYSSTANALTITTTAATPAGTYQVTVVFTETVSGPASSWILLPILLIPLVLLRRRLAARGVWVTACFGLVLLVATAIACTGCGGGGSTPPTPQTHQVTSSATITLIVQQ